MIQSIRGYVSSFLPERDSPLITIDRVKKIALPILLILELLLLVHFPPLGKMFLLTALFLVVTAFSEVEILEEPMQEHNLGPLFSRYVPWTHDVKLLTVR